ncbi:MAG: hypothetical protein ABSG25_02740 [Bryobacteraceae bacterium]
MPVDPKYLRQHYAELSDEALLEIDPSELVDVARQCFDDEIKERKLPSHQAVPRADERPATPRPPDPGDANDGNEAVGEELPGFSEDEPDWIEDATAVYSQADLPGQAPATALADARQVLDAAGIPTYVELAEMPEETSTAPKPTHVWQLMVPGELNMHATSVLQRDISNAEFEAVWKTYLENLSDKELRTADPREVLCGLFDRVERVTKAYDKEFVRRRLSS